MRPAEEVEPLGPATRLTFARRAAHTDGMPRFSLRTLIVVMLLAGPLMAGAWWWGRAIQHARGIVELPYNITISKRLAYGVGTLVGALIAVGMVRLVYFLWTSYERPPPPRMDEP